MVTNSDGTRNRLVFKDPPEENFAGQRAFPHASFPCRAANSSIGAIAGPQPSAMLLPQLAHQPAADQPSQGLNEEVPGEVLVLVGRPAAHRVVPHHRSDLAVKEGKPRRAVGQPADIVKSFAHRSEEHTSELQSLAYLVCRLLLEKKKTTQKRSRAPDAHLLL